VTSSSDDYVYSLDLHFDPFVHLHQKLSQRSMNHQQLLETYIEEIIDGMDHKTMYQYVYDNLYDHLNKYDDEELREEVKEYYPHILEESEEPSEATGWQ